MHILLTGATGYIGQRLIKPLLEKNHKLTCCVRSKARFSVLQDGQVDVLETDLSKGEAPEFPNDIDAAYFLIHSMSEGGKFGETEERTARNFLSRVEKTKCRQVIYLSGIVNEKELSPHLESRLAVEKILRAGRVPVTVLRAGIIVGSGSSSFEIIRDLVEKLPFMITPKWVETLCQPIGIRNVIEFLTGVLSLESVVNNDFDIGGPEVLSYKKMLLEYAAVRGLKRKIIVVPVFTPRLSSYWLYFITSTSYSLAVNLVESMKVNVVCRPNHLAEDLGIRLLTYRQSVELAFQKIEQNEVVSSWTDAYSVFNTSVKLGNDAQVPSFGTLRDEQKMEITGNADKVLDSIWNIGGNRGWYYGNALWKARGFIDRAFGGVGLRRGRTTGRALRAGDSLDFWRVIAADRKEKRLLLAAEMKLPGEAWLEFRIGEEKGKSFLCQTATFRPRGVLGRLYWYSMLPFHFFIFAGMIRNIVATGKE